MSPKVFQVEILKMNGLIIKILIESLNKIKRRYSNICQLQYQTLLMIYVPLYVVLRADNIKHGLFKNEFYFMRFTQ